MLGAHESGDFVACLMDFARHVYQSRGNKWTILERVSLAIEQTSITQHDIAAIPAEAQQRKKMSLLDPLAYQCS